MPVMEGRGSKASVMTAIRKAYKYPTANPVIPAGRFIVRSGFDSQEMRAGYYKSFCRRHLARAAGWPEDIHGQVDFGVCILS